MKIELTEELFSEMLEWKRLYDEEVQRVVNVLRYWESIKNG